MAVTSPFSTMTEEQERREVEALLHSGALGKAPNLQNFLKFVAQQYFAGEADQLKEYSIAVHALRRPETFDPQLDTIVRVTAHTLRKRLEHYYAIEGLDHPVHIQLPAGKYVLRFVHREASAPAFTKPSASSFEDVSADVPTDEDALEVTRAENTLDLEHSYHLTSTRNQNFVKWSAIIAGFACVILCFVVHFGDTRVAKDGVNAPSFEVRPSPAAAAAIQRGDAVPALDHSTPQRLLFGTHISPYTDTAGRVWTAATVCEGGTGFNHHDQGIRGTDDPFLYQQGREGRFHCSIYAAPGVYQLELLFADTAGDKEAARQIVFTINNGANQELDVVDEAGASNIALGKVYAGVHPMADGKIHLDFLSEGAFVSAAVLTPSRSPAGETFRMLAGPATMRDEEGQLWGPEQFFLGGRRTFHPDNLPRTADPRLFEWERYGHFQYAVPVATGQQYTVRLYFSEGWFGTSNGGPGGTGSRVFDVYCNGSTLLENFDILRDQHNGAVIVVSHHVKPTASGILNLYFQPIKNYPLVNAVSIEPES